MVVITARGRVRKTLWNAGVILSRIGDGRRAHLAREELDVRSPEAPRLPHGAVIAAGALFYVGISARLSR